MFLVAVFQGPNPNEFVVVPLFFALLHEPVPLLAAIFQLAIVFQLVLMLLFEMFLTFQFFLPVAALVFWC